MKAKNTRVFINCEEAKHICDKSQYNESSWWERFRLNLRMIYCNITRSYVKRNRKLTNLVNSNEVDCMDNEKKNDLKASFEKELQNSH